jgi:transposase
MLSMTSTSRESEQYSEIHTRCVESRIRTSQDQLEAANEHITHTFKGVCAMSILKYIVGIDVSMKTFEARFGSLDTQQQTVLSSSQSFSNALTGFKHLVRWTMRFNPSPDVPLVFVMEATGVYYERLARFLVANKFPVAVVLPNKIKNYAQSLQSKSKTDPLDAAAITRFGLDRHLELWTPPSDTVKALRNLSREYRELKTTITTIKNRRHALRASFAPQQRSLRRKEQLLKLLQLQTDQIEEELHHLVDNDPVLSERVPTICRTKGIGFITVVAVLAETRCFDQVTGQKQLASYAGLDVVFNNSGLRKGKTSISRKGNAFLRTAVFMPALAAARSNPRFKELYQRLVAKGKNKKLALIAVARKLLLLIYALWKNNTAYDPNYS